MFVPTKENRKLDNGKRGHYQVIQTILCRFTNSSIIFPIAYFITVKVTLTIKSHRVPLNVMLVLKCLHLKLLKTAILWNLRVFLGIHPNGLRKNGLSSN